jgi:hypothetical protein
LLIQKENFALTKTRPSFLKDRKVWQTLRL